SEKPIYGEYERFKSLVEGVKSNIIVAHIRRASNPRGLSMEKLISIENTQPFSYGNLVFAHNGVIMISDEVSNLLGEWKQMIRGLNDSEVYFWYIVKELHEGRSIRQALRNFEEDLWMVWSEGHGKYAGKIRPYMGLNMILSDGSSLYAYCKYDESLNGATRSLCYRDQPAMQMAYIASSDRLVVASEKTNAEEDWRPLKSGQLISGKIEDGRVKISLEAI
ncbi:MAG: class II glutamine amidotransferase, partial [Candidatus Bathyarchaeota archaeon]|nr:class II glutamine amidotransferase [Candidatus Bathyarchaeota archaeon]